MKPFWDVPALGSPELHRLDVRVHGTISVIIGSLALLLSPLADPSGPVAVVGALALLGGAPALLLPPERTSRRGLTAGHMGASAGMVLMAGLIGHPLEVTAGPLILAVLTVHASCMRSRRETWLQVAWALALYAVLLIVAVHELRAIAAWCTLATVLSLLAATVTWLRARLDLLIAELRRLAERDPLTGLLLLDADHFKALNDRYGHLAGDAALTWLGDLLDTAVPPPGLVSRYGGEEVVVLIPVDCPAAAVADAERLRLLVERRGAARPQPFTVSIGVAVGRLTDDLSDLYGQADNALYRAKDKGRNRVEVEPDPQARLATAAG